MISLLKYHNYKRKHNNNNIPSHNYRPKRRQFDGRTDRQANVTVGAGRWTLHLMEVFTGGDFTIIYTKKEVKNYFDIFSDLFYAILCVDLHFVICNFKRLFSILIKKSLHYGESERQKLYYKSYFICQYDPLKLQYTYTINWLK